MLCLCRLAFLFESYSLDLLVSLLCSLDGRQSDRLGKYVNDSPPKYANCVPNVLLIHGRPHVTIFAATTIMPGTELRYNYGGCVPWRMVGLE